MEGERVPSREVHCAEALAWMAEHPAPPGASVVTSLPDVSELPHLGFDGWRDWFVDAAQRVIRWVQHPGAAVFYQSDVRRGAVLVDKGYLIQRAAEASGADIAWHKIVCRRPPGTVAHGRPSYSHMICVLRGPAIPPRNPGPDVLPDAGFAPWTRAMGALACREACRYLRDEREARVIVDPFCGRGTALAVANEMGMDAIGVDLSARRCRSARGMRVGMGASPPRTTRE